VKLRYLWSKSTSEGYGHRRRAIPIYFHGWTAVTQYQRARSSAPMSPNVWGSSKTRRYRYRDAATKHGALTSCLYSLRTYLHLSTERLEIYAKGTKNVNIHFQAVLCQAQQFASFQHPRISDIWK